MPNIIEIVLHATDASSAQINNVIASTNELKASTSGLVDTLMGPAGIAAASVVAAGAMAVMADKFAENVVNLSNLSAKSNININSLRDLQTAMREARLPSDSLNMALGLLARNLEAGKKSLVAMVGDTKDPMEALLRLSELAAKSGDAALIAFQAMGRGGMQLAPILATLSERVKDVQKRLDDIGPATVEAAKEFDDMVQKMITAGKNLADKVGGALVNQIMLDIRQTKEEWKAFAAAIEQGSPPVVAAIQAVAAALTMPPPPQYAPGATDVPGAPPGFFGKVGKPGPELQAILDFFKANPDLDPTTQRTRATPRWQVGDFNEIPTKLGWMVPANLKLIQQALHDSQGSLSSFMETAASGIGESFSSAFATVVTAGANAANLLRSIFGNLAFDLAKAFATTAFGWLLGEITSFATGGGPDVGASFGGFGGPRIPMAPNSVININTIDVRSLRQQLGPTGSLNRAIQQATIGGRS